LEGNVATIEARPDKMATGLWWLVWIEREETVARVEQEPGGLCRILPEGPHWSPMKSFGRSYDGLGQALTEVRLYFQGR
jgi:hypothetical protein